MGYVILALAIIAIAFAIFAIVVTYQKAAVARDLAAARAAIASATSANATQVAEAARLERVIADKAAEIAELEKDIEACSSPDAVRAALRSLSASLSGGARAGDHVPANTTPPGAAGPVRGA